MIDQGSNCGIIKYLIYQELEKLDEKMTIYRSKIKAKTYNGSDIRMFGHTSIQYKFDTDGKYPFNLKVWITEENTAYLLVVDFCHIFLKGLNFDIPAVELKLKEDEQSLLILIENQKDHPVILNKFILGYAVNAMQGYEGKIYAIHDCDEFTTRFLNESLELDNCFMLKKVVNTTQESHTQLSGPCLQYVDFKKRPIFESKMPIAQTISADGPMKKEFAEMFCKRYSELRLF